jgi:hypothetical protein
VRCATLGFELYPFQGTKQKTRNFKNRAVGQRVYALRLFVNVIPVEMHSAMLEANSSASVNPPKDSHSGDE